MTRISTWETDLPSLGPAAIAIGVFDGVHLGHQALVHDTVDFAATVGATSAIVTFDRDPDRVVAPDAAAPQLLEAEDKYEFLSQLGADHLLVVPFDVQLASLTPERFLREVLLSAFQPVATVVGRDFRFGRGASGDVTTLERFAEEHSFTVIAHDLVTMEGAPITSTRIRGAVASGDVRLAARLLGHPHRLRGRVERGRGDGGATLGFPTANLAIHPWAAMPESGVYAAYALVDGERHAAAVNIGAPPMFPGAHYAVEAHLIGYDGTLYGHEMVLEFIDRVRAIQRYESLDALSRAIRRDVETISTMLATGDSSR